MCSAIFSKSVHTVPCSPGCEDIFRLESYIRNSAVSIILGSPVFLWSLIPVYQFLSREFFRICFGRLYWSKKRTRAKKSMCKSSGDMKSVRKTSTVEHTSIYIFKGHALFHHDEVFTCAVCSLLALRVGLGLDLSFSRSNTIYACHRPISRSVLWGLGGLGSGLSSL